MYKIKTEKFSGPLDLLLQLIEEHKMDITEVSLAQVTDNYISYIEGMEDKDPEELSDFLVIAARLLVIKSKAILPVMEEEEVLDDLEKQLKIYKEFLDASKKIAEMLKQEKFLYSRAKPAVDLSVEFSPSENITTENLRKSFLVVLKRLDPLVKMPKKFIDKAVSLQQKILHLRDFIARSEKSSLKEILKDAKSKSDVIVSFLAMLELVKQKQLVVRQGNLFDDIILEQKQ